MSRSQVSLCIVLSTAMLVGCWWLADLILQPIPTPLGGAMVFGWLGHWVCFVHKPLRGLVVGALLGATLGAVVHVRSHIVEDRVESAASLAAHVLADLGVSLLGAAAALAASVGWVFALRSTLARRG